MAETLEKTESDAEVAEITNGIRNDATEAIEDEDEEDIFAIYKNAFLRDKWSIVFGLIIVSLIVMIRNADVFKSSDTELCE